MTEFIRVRADNGSEISVPATYEQAFEMKPLNKPATDRFGRPLPTKQHRQNLPVLPLFRLLSVTRRYRLQG